MASAKQQTAGQQGERFPTEWSLQSGDERYGGWQVPPSEDVGAEGRTPISTVEDDRAPF